MIHANKSEPHRQPLAAFDITLLLMIPDILMLLSKVQSFVWIQMASKGVPKLLVGNLTVLVEIKLVENVFELLVGKNVAPTFQ